MTGSSILARLSEPSTWAGVAVLFSTLAPYVEHAAGSSSVPGIAATVLSGLVAVIKAESGSKS